MVGQEHVIQTLTNAITNKRLSHAYIFSGPRGTGKTSAARIFAKSVNTFEVESQLDNLDNQICQRISQGTCVDVVEIDAASNTGIDNIRDLNDKVNFTPVECAYKFYIIDEVHMLSTGAFNALLKTLEEPPSHTIFVLATTEPHKIPITIHSRCQHLRFRNLSDSEIISQLNYICDKESITISDTACAVLSRNASGCMRDALSLLDQMYSFRGNTITDEDVVTILGTCDVSLVGAIVEAVCKGDSFTIVSLLGKTRLSGVNPLQLIKDLLAVVEQVLAFQSGSKDMVKLNLDMIQNLANISDMSHTIGLLDCLSKVESETRWFSNPGILLQIRLIQLFVGGATDNQMVQTSTSSSNSQTGRRSSSSMSKSEFQPISDLPVQPITSQEQSNNIMMQKSVAINSQEFKKTSQDPAISGVMVTDSKEHMGSNVSVSKLVQYSKNLHSLESKESRNDTSSVQSQDKKDILFYQKQWGPLLIHIKGSHTGLFTILRQSTVAKFEGSKLTIKLFRPVQFFVEKLMESSYKSAFKTFLKEFFNQDLDFSVLDMTQKATSLDASEEQKQGDMSSSVQASSQDTDPTEELTINAIVSLFEGKVL